eukprot:EG_transcript_62567
MLIELIDVWMEGFPTCTRRRTEMNGRVTPNLISQPLSRMKNTHVGRGHLHRATDRAAFDGMAQTYAECQATQWERNMGWNDGLNNGRSFLGSAVLAWASGGGSEGEGQ